MSELLVVDWRGVVKNLSYSIMSGAIACAFPTEPEEIGHRVAKWFFALRAEYPSAKILIANDKRPYWRHRYLLNWYGERGLEPVVYKGNREKQSWPFATDRVGMESLYAALLDDVAAGIQAIIAEDVGLEADDIWGLLATASKRKVIGISADSDWRQCITPDGRVSVFDFTTDTMHREPNDIRIKWIGGDSGDNIRGCGKKKKNGTPAQKGWGKDGAEKLLATNPNWQHVIDPDELERNRIVTTLPCPLWDIPAALEDLNGCCRKPEHDASVWDRWGVTKPVRELLERQAEREAFRAKLRLTLAKTAMDRAAAKAAEDLLNG